MNKRAVLTIAVGALLWSAPLAAQPSAQALFEEGKRLLHQGDYANACTKLGESMKLDASLGTELHLAECHARLGQTATAWREFREAESWAEMKGDARLKLARQRIQELAPLVPKLVVAVTSPAPGLEVHLDGQPLERSQWGVAVPVDPRAHEITAEAPGRKRWARTINVAPNGATANVTIPALDEDEKVREAPSVIAPTPADHPTTSNPSSGRGNAQRVAGVVVVATGAGGIVVGSILAGIAKSKLDFSNAGHCRAGNICDGIGVRARSEALDLAGASTVAMIAGGLAVVGGVVLFIVAPREKPLRVGVSPAFGGASLTLHGVW